MAEFRLPKNSRPTEGKHYPAQEGATNVRRFVVSRYAPDAAQPPPPTSPEYYERESLYLCFSAQPAYPFNSDDVGCA